MANIVPYAFPVELLSGTHNFASGGDTFKIALYTANPYTTLQAQLQLHILSMQK
jgi:hypothetical protein